jgi:hypothetical protein
MNLTTKVIEGCGSEQRPHLGSGGTHKKTFYEIFQRKYRETSSRYFQRVTKNKKMCLVERSAPFKVKKEVALG